MTWQGLRRTGEYCYHLTMQLRDELDVCHETSLEFSLMQFCVNVFADIYIVKISCKDVMSESMITNSPRDLL